MASIAGRPLSVAVVVGALAAIVYASALSGPTAPTPNLPRRAAASAAVERPSPVDLPSPEGSDRPRIAPAVVRAGISQTAKAVSFNFTVTQPTALGHLSVYPGGTPLPLVSVINYDVGQTRANNAIVPLGPDGSLEVYSGQISGTTHFIIDVNGYFE